jgi:hypothetical protein
MPRLGQGFLTNLNQVGELVDPNCAAIVAGLFPRRAREANICRAASPNQFLDQF